MPMTQVCTSAAHLICTHRPTPYFTAGTGVNTLRISKLLNIILVQLNQMHHQFTIIKERKSPCFQTDIWMTRSGRHSWILSRLSSAVKVRSIHKPRTPSSSLVSGGKIWMTNITWRAVSISRNTFVLFIWGVFVCLFVHTVAAPRGGQPPHDFFFFFFLLVG